MAVKTQLAGRYVKGDELRRLRFETSSEVLRLAEDISAIKQAIALIQSVDPRSITASITPSDRDFARTMINTTQTMLRSWKQYAQLKLREYIAPK
jgi:hypothetical protein